MNFQQTAAIIWKRVKRLEQGLKILDRRVEVTKKCLWTDQQGLAFDGVQQKSVQNIITDMQGSHQNEKSWALLQEPEVAGFISKTFQILTIDDYQKIIQWSPNGLDFVIKDVAKLEEIVLPRYFRHNKINSFVRQLNMYGFHKIKHTSLKSTFRHPFFQRNQSHLLPCVIRKIKQNQPKEETYFSKSESRVIVKPEPLVQEIQEEKWLSTNQFLASTQLLNCDLVQMSCNYLTDIATTLTINEDCLSIQDQIDCASRQLEFQDPSCFFASMFDLAH